MKALSIRNPFAFFMLSGEKTIECRSWQTDFRGDILICSSAAPKMKGTISGHALMVATLDRIEPFTEEHLEAACMDEMPGLECYAWHLTNFRLIKPFKVKGKLKLFDVDDSLIEVIDSDDSGLTDKESEEQFNKYFLPLFN